MCEKDYTALLPTAPPEGLISWLKENGNLGGQYIIYKSANIYVPLEDRRRRMVECHCTACNQTFYEEYIPSEDRLHVPFYFQGADGYAIGSGDEYICPNCGAEVEVRHNSNMGTRSHGTVITQKFPLTVHNIGGNLALLCWCVERRVNRSGEEHIAALPYDGYLFTDSKKIRFNGRASGAFRVYFTGTWRQIRRFEDKVGEFTADMIYPFDVSILNGTAAENSKLDKYIACAEETYPVSYIALYQRYPSIENLVMSGWGDFLNYKIYRTSNAGSDFPKVGLIRGLKMSKAKPSEILGLDKMEMRYIKAHQWNNEQTDIYIRAKSQGLTLENAVSTINQYSKYYIEQLIGTDANIPRALRYVEKQKKKYRAEHKDGYCPITARYLADYWDMAEQNGDDLSDDAIRYPHRLETAHDNASELLTIKANAKKEKKFKQRYEELKKYRYENNGLLIRPAASLKEFIDEGKALCHCVASYADRHADGKVSIFFIRRSNAPEVPYYTLQYDFDNMCIVQNHGYKNDRDTPVPKEVTKFAQKWDARVKRAMCDKNKNTTKKKRSAA